MATFEETSNRFIDGMGSKVYNEKRGTLTLTAEGGTSGDLPASLFGLISLSGVDVAIKTDDSAIALFAVSSDGSELFATNLAQSTDASRPNKADLTGTYSITIRGY